MAHECSPRQPSQNRELQRHLPRAAGQLTSTRQWCEYQLQLQASDVFSGEAPPHVPLIFFDLLRRQRDAQVAPQTSDALEGDLPPCFITESGGMVQNLLLFLSR